MSGTHEDLTRRLEPNGSTDRGFGIVFAVAFTVIGCLPLLHGRPVRLWSFGVAALFLAVALAMPRLLALLNLVWTKVGWLIQKVMHPLVMGLIFYLVFTPAGLIMRWRGKDPLRLKFEPQSVSYWIPRVPAGPDGPSMARQF